MPSKHSVIPLDRQFTPADMEAIRRGVIPEAMEDKWFIYWGDDRLFFHRSWTGYCVYVVRFETHSAGWTMVEALANRDSGQYLETNDESDAAMISYLIDVVLLHRPREFPGNQASEVDQALRQWSQVGRAGLGGHPKDD